MGERQHDAVGYRRTQARLYGLDLRHLQGPWRWRACRGWLPFGGFPLAGAVWTAVYPAVANSGCA